MARLVVCALALLVAGSLSTPVKKEVPRKIDTEMSSMRQLIISTQQRIITNTIADKTLARRQYDLNVLYYHIHEPNHIPTCHAISTTYVLEKNLEHYSNVSAVKTYIKMLENNWILPRGMPFSVHQSGHRFEATTLFNMLFSAKDYDTFYKTAVFLRDRVNENMFVYVLSVVTLNRKDTQGIRIVPIHEILPFYFHNGEIMTTAQRINTHGHHMVEYYPSTYMRDNSVIIRWNETLWPFHNDQSMPIAYYSHDIAMNTLYFNFHLLQPSWLGGEVVPLIKDRRGELFWFVHKQVVARYYLERLSNGLGEISELGHHVVKEGYYSGLLYHNGVAFPARPEHFHLDQPHFVDELQEITDYERRIRDAIERGYAINSAGEHISLRTPESIDVLGRLIEANVDSPNVHFYKDFISIWKKVLGNSVVHRHHYSHHFASLVVPSVLEHYQTALRDPAFYMIWKRVLGLFQIWQDNLPHYKPEELALPSVAIQNVDVDKLSTYFEYSYTNVTEALHMDEEEVKTLSDDIDVLVQQPRLNHKTFQVRVHVKSEVAKTVVVRFFLAPKYDSHGYEIPLHVNSHNFYQFDEFIHDLPAGEIEILRSSDDNNYATHNLPNFIKLTGDAFNAAEGHGDFVIEEPAAIHKLPHHLLLPKGRVDGMPFVFMVYISEYRAPKVPAGTGFDHTMSIGLGSGARYLTDDPFGFPVNRPLYNWLVEDVHNLALHDVLIYHKHAPEVQVPHSD